MSLQFFLILFIVFKYKKVLLFVLYPIQFNKNITSLNLIEPSEFNGSSISLIYFYYLHYLQKFYLETKYLVYSKVFRKFCIFSINLSYIDYLAQIKFMRISK